MAGLDLVKDRTIKSDLYQGTRDGLIVILDRVDGQEVSPSVLFGEKSLTIMFFRAVISFYEKLEDPSYVDEEVDKWLQGKTVIENTGVTSELECKQFLRQLKDVFPRYATCQYFESINSFNSEPKRQLEYIKDPNNQICFNLQKYMDDARTSKGTLKEPTDLKRATKVANAINALDSSIDKDLYAYIPASPAEDINPR